MDVSREHIEIVQGEGGPKARIAGHRVLVEHVVGWHEDEGLSVTEIVEQIPTISRADVFAALAYYWDHKDALDEQWRQDRAWAEEFRRAHEGPLNETVKQRRVG
jgi:uncharacterized protein (DUF433 family)